MMANFFWVALGGAIGSMGRYGISLLLVNATKSFPFATLTVNIVGSFLLGLLVMSQQQQQLGQHGFLLLGVGVLGAFTTFSTFSVEVILLAQQGEWVKAVLFAALNVGVCLVAVLAAMALYPSGPAA